MSGSTLSPGDAKMRHSPAGGTSARASMNQPGSPLSFTNCTTLRQSCCGAWGSWSFCRVRDGVSRSDRMITQRFHGTLQHSQVTSPEGRRQSSLHPKDKPPWVRASEPQAPSALGQGDQGWGVLETWQLPAPGMCVTCSLPSPVPVSWFPCLAWGCGGGGGRRGWGREVELGLTFTEASRSNI